MTSSDEAESPAWISRKRRRDDLDVQDRHEHPEHHEDERRDPLEREIALRDRRRRDDEIGRRRRPAWPYRGDRAGHGFRLRVAKASSPSAPSSVGFGGAGSRVWTVATTERPGPERDLFQHLLGEGDAHRDPLDDLGEVAGRVVRRQQRELRAGGRGDRRHHALDHLAVERVDGDIDLLPRLDVRELGFLEVGVDIGSVERHERHQPGSRLHQVADLSRLVADGSVERRDDAGERKIALRHRRARHEFVALARGLVLLRLEHIEIGLCAVERRGGRRLARLGGGQGGDGAVAVGGRLLETLLRAEIGLRELERAVIFQGGPLDVGLGALDLRRAPNRPGPRPGR